MEKMFLIGFVSFLAGVMVMALVASPLHYKAMESKQAAYDAAVIQAYAEGPTFELLPPPAM